MSLPQHCRAPVRAALGALLFVIGVASAWGETGVTDSEIKLGQSSAYTGVLAALGNDYRDGAQLYFEQVNAAGGIAGRKITLITLDDGYVTDKAKANTATLLDQEKVFALFGYLGTGIAEAHLPIVAERKVPMFAPYTGADSLRNAQNKYLFNVRASYGDEIAKHVRHLATLGYSKVSLVYNNDAFGKSVVAAVEAEMSKNNKKLTAATALEPQSPNFAAAVATLSKDEPQVVLLGVAGGNALGFLKEYMKLPQRPQFHGLSVISSQQLVKELGPNAHGITISQVMPFPWRATIPLVTEYRRALTAKDPKAEPRYTHFEGFVAAKVFVEALKRTGKDLTRDKLIGQLEKFSPYDAGGFTVSFAPGNHNGSRWADLTIVGREGRFVQ